MECPLGLLLLLSMPSVPCPYAAESHFRRFDDARPPEAVGTAS